MPENKPSEPIRCDFLKCIKIHMEKKDNKEPLYNIINKCLDSVNPDQKIDYLMTY